jgi:hypothetical protein
MVARPDNDQHTFLVIPLRTTLAPFLTRRRAHPHHNRDRQHDRRNPPPIETINNTIVETINNTIVEAITEPTTESPNTQSRKMTTGQHASILPQGRKGQGRKGQGEIIPTC